MTGDAPKSAYELAMERLRKRDAEEGVSERQLTDDQKEAIAEARSIHSAKVAELEILHRSRRRTAQDPAELARLDEEYHRELQRLGEDSDRKIEKIRGS